MKKLVKLIGISLLVVGTFSALVGLSQVKGKEIHMDDAKDIALQKVNGQIIECEVDDDEYEMKILKDHYVHEVDVHKTTGHMKHHKKEREAHHNLSYNEAKDLVLSKINGKIISYKEDSDEYEFCVQKDQKQYELDVCKETGRIDDFKEVQSVASVLFQEEIKKIALNRINGTILEIEYDREDQSYEVEIKQHHYKYEMEIDAVTGKILKIETGD